MTITLDTLLERAGRHLPDALRSAILRSAAVVAGVTVVVKLAGMGKELLVASQFGRGDDLDAFLIAMLLPSLIINVVAGAFNPAMVPALVEVRRRHGQAEAQALLSNVLALGAVLMLGVSVLLALSSSWLIPLLCHGFAPEKAELTRHIFLWLLPALTLKGLASVWADTLNAGRRFALASAAPALNALGIIAALLLWGQALGVVALVGGLLAGFALECLVLTAAVKRAGWTLLPRWHGMDAHTAAVLRQFAPALASGVLMSSTELVDSAMAAMLPAGSVAALSYGNKLVAFVLGIVATSITTAALPHLSEMVAERRYAAMRHELAHHARLFIVVGVPVTLVLIALSPEIVALIFQRGAFSAADARVVAQVQEALLLQVPFYMVSGFTVRFASALRANHVMLWGTVLSVGVNVVFNLIFMAWLGVVGIALSTALVYVVSAAFLSWSVRRLLDQRARELT